MEFIAFLIWMLLTLLVLWMMSNEKIKVIFGEVIKILRVLPLTKIAEAIFRKNDSGNS